VACQINVTSIEFLLSHIPFSDKVIQAMNKRALGVPFYVEGKCAKSRNEVNHKLVGPSPESDAVETS
jgi:hypothetical protein